MNKFKNIIAHSNAKSGLYIGTPSICILNDGSYLASHDYFGPNSNEYISPKVFIYKSYNKGQSWDLISVLENAFWNGLFIHKNIPYIMGTNKHHGDIVIRKSIDGGFNWTIPKDSKTGLLTNGESFHTSSMPIVYYKNKLWRTIENANGGKEWGLRYKAGLLSINEDADLLNADNWDFSNFLSGNKKWLNNSFNGWLEGNVVINPEGRLINLIRVDSHLLPEVIAELEIKENKIKYNNKFIEFNGGSKKFVIRYNEIDKYYYTISSIIKKEYEGLAHPMKIRNTLALMKSKDLNHWEIQKELIISENYSKHGFQYVDWLFENQEIIAVCRTAYDDKFNGANNNHDSNYLTFHRWNIN